MIRNIYNIIVSNLQKLIFLLQILPTNTMNSLPLELILEIASNNLEAFHGLAMTIPRFNEYIRDHPEYVLMMNQRFRHDLPWWVIANRPNNKPAIVIQQHQSWYDQFA